MKDLYIMETNYNNKFVLIKITQNPVNHTTQPDLL